MQQLLQNQMLKKYAYNSIHIFTSCRESQLPASHSGIISSKGIITDSAPGIVVADLYTTLLCRCATNQSDCTLCTTYVCTKEQLKWVICMLHKKLVN